MGPQNVPVLRHIPPYVSQSIEGIEHVKKIATVNLVESLELMS
jgi:hypothetical protein